MKYRLIKKYPGSPELGTVVKENSYLDPIARESSLKNYPEFWEEIIERNYEILSFRSTSFYTKGLVFNDCTKSEKIMKTYLKDMNGGFCKIYSIKRLSDGEIFTIGDRINNKFIKGFKIEDDSIKIVLHYDLEDKIVGTSYLKLSAAKKNKQPLFTTEDGVRIYEGDKIYWTLTGGLGSISSQICSKESSKWVIVTSNTYKTFSTREAAEEYILMNKPCLSINDIPLGCDRHEALMELKELVKSKL